MQHNKAHFGGMISLYMLVARTRTLGPGLRFALWVQGCPKSCPGCLAANSLPFDGGEVVSTHTLAQCILEDEELEGLTLSGGEPFSQAKELSRLIQMLRLKRPNLSVIVYSGHRLETLKKMALRDPSVASLLGHLDVLIDGPYIDTLNDQKSLRGSSNQRVWCLTERYRDVVPQLYGQVGRQVEIHQLGDTTAMVGVPGQAVLSAWQSGQLQSKPNKE